MYAIRWNRTIGSKHEDMGITMFGAYPTLSEARYHLHVIGVQLLSRSKDFVVVMQDSVKHHAGPDIRGNEIVHEYTIEEISDEEWENAVEYERDM